MSIEHSGTGKIVFMQSKITNFYFALVLPFCQYCGRRLTFENLAYIHRKAAIFTVLNLYFVLQ